MARLTLSFLKKKEKFRHFSSKHTFEYIISRDFKLSKILCLTEAVAGQSTSACSFEPAEVKRSRRRAAQH